METTAREPIVACKNPVGAAVMFRTQELKTVDRDVDGNSKMGVPGTHIYYFTAISVTGYRQVEWRQLQIRFHAFQRLYEVRIHVQIIVQNLSKYCE
jgi:hypothetical protein